MAQAFVEAAVSPSIVRFGIHVLPSDMSVSRFQSLQVAQVVRCMARIHP